MNLFDQLVNTALDNRDLPAQRIHIDVCAIPSYTRQPRTLLNPYGVDMGTQGLILNAETQEEIYTDKILALALRRGRIKNRDLWDLLWLKQQGIEPALELISDKLRDHKTGIPIFLEKAQSRAASLSENEQIKQDFRNEMQRFLPTPIVADTVNNDRFWHYLSSEIPALINRVERYLNGREETDTFRM